MIDQSAIGLPTVHTSHSGGKRDKAGASLDHGKSASSFGDLVAQAGKKHVGKFDVEAKDDTRASVAIQAVEKTQVSDKATVADKISALDALTVDGNLLPDDPNQGNFETGKDSRASTGAKADNQVKAGAESAPAVGKEPKVQVGDLPEIGDRPKNANEHKVQREPEVHNEHKTVKDPTRLNDPVIGTDRKTEPKIETAPVIAIESDAASETNADAGEQPAEGRIRLSSGFQYLMRTSADGGILRSADDRISPAKGENVETGKQQGIRKGELPDVDEAKAKSPAEELRALLGLEPEEAPQAEEPVENAAEPLLAKTSGDDDQRVDSKAAKPEPIIDAALQAAGTAAAEVFQPAPMQHAAFKATADKIPSAEADTDANDKQPEIDVEKIRIVSSDGKARAVDIELAKSKADDNAMPTTGGKTEFVTVLESRRYLGFGNDSNAGALTNAIKSDSSWAQVIQSVNNGSHHTATQVNTLKLQLNPENLGNMTAQLRLKGEELSIELKVETVEAYRQLSNDHDGILKALKDQGFTIDQVSIQLSQSARSDSSQNNASQNNGNQQGNGQAPQEGQGDNARQRDESARRNSGNQNNWMSNDRTSFSDSGSSSDDAGTGNIYL